MSSSDAPNSPSKPLSKGFLTSSRSESSSWTSQKPTAGSRGISSRTPRSLPIDSTLSDSSTTTSSRSGSNWIRRAGKIEDFCHSCDDTHTTSNPNKPSNSKAISPESRPSASFGISNKLSVPCSSRKTGTNGNVKSLSRGFWAASASSKHRLLNPSKRWATPWNPGIRKSSECGDFQKLMASRKDFTIKWS